MKVPVLAVLLALLLVVPAVHAVPGRVLRINPIVGLADPDFRDNALSLDDPAFDAAMMDVEFAPFELLTAPSCLGCGLATDSVGWGNERFVIVGSATPPDGNEVRRDDPRFLEHMAWFYLNHAVDRIEALGYTVPFDQPLAVRAHDTSGQWVEGRRVPVPAFNADASCCNGGIRLLYRAASLEGQGGMGSAAEDAEVIVHELGHYLHTRMSTVTYDAPLYGEFAEGTADLFAVLLLDDLSNGVSDACQAEWLYTYYPADIAFELDGYRCGRVLRNDLVWPEDAFGEIHRDGMFWATPMWSVREALGTPTTLRLLIESLSRMPNNLSSFDQMGRAVLGADAALYGGRDEAVIRAAFAEHGIALPTLQEMLGNRTLRDPLVKDPTFVAETQPSDDGSAQESPGPVMAATGLLLIALVAFRRRA